MINLDLYKKLSDEETVPIWDNKKQEFGAISKMDFDVDRQGEKQRYVFSGEQGFFEDKEGNTIATNTEDFYNFYDNSDYRYLDSSILDSITTDKDKLKTGEFIRDILPKGKVGTGLANVFDAIGDNFSFGAVNFINKKTRSEELAEKRLREEAGAVGAAGTVIGEVIGILGATKATAGIGAGATTAALGSRYASKFPKLASGIKKTKEFLSKGKGLKHTLLTGAAYTSPWALVTSIGQKDVGKGVEQMAWGAGLPYVGHMIGKGALKIGQAGTQVIRDAMFKVPKKIKPLNDLKDEISKSIDVDPDIIPDKTYFKIAKRLGVKKGVKGFSVQDKKELIMESKGNEMLEVMTDFTNKYASQTKKGLAWTRHGIYKDLRRFQKVIGKEIGDVRNVLSENPKDFGVFGHTVKKELEKAVPQKTFYTPQDVSAIKKFTNREGILKTGEKIRNKIKFDRKIRNMTRREVIKSLKKKKVVSDLKHEDAVNELTRDVETRIQDLVVRLLVKNKAPKTSKEIEAFTKEALSTLRKEKKIRGEVDKSLLYLTTDRGILNLRSKEGLKKLKKEQSLRKKQFTENLNKIKRKEDISKLKEQNVLKNLKVKQEGMKGLIDQIIPTKKYTLNQLKELRDNFEPKFGKDIDKTAVDIDRAAYTLLSDLEERVISDSSKIVKDKIAKGNKDYEDILGSLEVFNKKKSKFVQSNTILDVLDKASGPQSMGLLFENPFMERILIYGGAGYVGHLYGSPLVGATFGVGLAGAITTGLGKGFYYKPVESIVKNFNKMNNFIDSIFKKSKVRAKALESVTVNSIRANLLGSTGDEDDLNGLAMELSQSVSEPHKSNSGSSREVVEGLFGSLNVNSTERKLSAAETYSRLESVVLNNIKFHKKGSKQAKQAKEDFLKNVAPLFSPEILFENIRNGSLTQKQVDNFRAVYPRMYNSIKSDIMLENSKKPLKDRLSYRQLVTLSRFTGENLTGLESLNYIQEENPTPTTAKQRVQNNEQYKFPNVSENLRKEIYSSKNVLQRAENF